MSFTAIYPDRCTDCDGHIHPGTAARYNDRDDIVHDRCPVVPSVEAAPGEVACGTCHLIHPGECF